MIRRPSVAALVISLASVAPPALAAEPITVESGLRFPAGIAFARDGTMFVTEREGRILAIDGKQRTTIASISTITEGETGLLGITMSPDDRWVYAFATEPDQTNTVWRVLASGGEPERVIAGLPGGGYHNGGGVVFGPDGHLYVSNGEKHDSDLAQDPEALGGKIYRYTAEGDIPPDNPFPGSPVWSLGHRNPFGIAIDPITGDAFVTENGPEAFDEINRVEAGSNHGWPVVSGPASGTDTGALVGRYRDPLLAYEEIIVPTGIAFADPSNALPSVAGDMFFGTYGDQTIHRVVMDEKRTEVIEDIVWYRSPEPIVAVAWGPRGLYYSTPGAVKLFELARREGSGPASSPEPRGRGGSSIDTGNDTPIALLLFGGAAAVLLGALAFAFGGKKRGRT